MFPKAVASPEVRYGGGVNDTSSRCQIGGEVNVLGSLTLNTKSSSDFFSNIGKGLKWFGVGGTPLTSP